MLHLPKASGRLSRLRKSRISRLNKILIQCFVWIRVNCIGKTISYLRINHLITQKLPNNFDKRVASPIPFVYWFGLQNLRRHMWCRAIKTKLIGVAAITYQCAKWLIKCKIVAYDKNTILNHFLTQSCGPESYKLFFNIRPFTTMILCLGNRIKN